MEQQESNWAERLAIQIGTLTVNLEMARDEVRTKDKRIAELEQQIENAKNGG